MAESQVKGVCLLSIFGFLREAGILEATLAKLSASHAQELCGVTPTGWYSVGAFVELLDKIHEHPHYRAPEVIFGLGRRVINDGLSGFAKAVATLVSPAVAVKRAPLLWSMYAKHSSMIVSSSAKGSASGYISYSGSTSRLLCNLLMGGFAEPVHLAGGKNVQVTHPRCRLDGHEHCYFDIRWEE